jgi:hypothetical protein
MFTSPHTPFSGDFFKKILELFCVESHDEILKLPITVLSSVDPVCTTVTNIYHRLDHGEEVFVLELSNQFQISVYFDLCVYQNTHLDGLIHEEERCCIFFGKGHSNTLCKEKGITAWPT